MSAKRFEGRFVLFTNALLLSTALAWPAAAQIEEVVVTAQKRTEDVQSVPIAVTAFTGKDLKTQQIDQFKDLQFHSPNVTFTTGALGGTDFQIRGIGITAVGYDAESGVAVNFDEVYLNAPNLTEGSFYDLSGIEILAGPQSTLYGRGASGGVVNVNIVKPDLETASVEMNATFGNYATRKVEGAVNLPIITDELGLRVAGEWDKRDGFVTNVFNNTNVDGLDQYSVRGTLRWEPTQNTQIDFTGQFTKEDDDHMRADKLLCTQDPTGILGCLPTSAGTQPVNNNAGESTIAASQQALQLFFENAFGLPPAVAVPLGAEMGLFNLQAPFTVPAGYVDPAGSRQVSTDFEPSFRLDDNFLSLKWHQRLASWLDSTMIMGYDHSNFISQQSYTNIPGFPLATNNNYTLVAPGLTANCLAAILGSPNLNCSELATLGAFTAFYGAFNPNYASYYAPYFSHPGEIPLSGIGNLGLTGGNYTFTPNDETHDQIDTNNSEYSGELRFATSFSGPINAMLGFYFLHTRFTGDYYVNSSPFDLTAIQLGGLVGPAFVPGCIATGCISAPSYYHNVGQDSTLNSKSVFGEVYYDAIPDTLRATLGLRYNDDEKFNSGRVLIYNNYLPIGTTNESAVTTPLIPVTSRFDKLTGRIVVDWTPKLDYTDQTLVYASYARGYKAGGANPGFEPSIPVPESYGPETIDAYEVGTKNELLGGTLQANGDVYFYQYYGLQVSATEDNTSVNENISAHVWGTEGNFVWAPTDRWQFGLGVAHEESMIGNTLEVDERNPTGGNPNTLLIKSIGLADGTVGQTCVAYFQGAFPGLTGNLIAPPGGQAALAQYGIAHVAYGDCGAPPPGYSFTGFASAGTAGGTALGMPYDLRGNELQNTPNLSLSLNAQYTQPLPGDYALVARVDVHWQTHFWERIFEQGADLVGSEEVADASLQLNSPDGLWYAQAYIKNIFNQNNITGGDLASTSSGLYTGALYGDPRTYGVNLGFKFD